MWVTFRCRCAPIPTKVCFFHLLFKDSGFGVQEKSLKYMFSTMNSRHPLKQNMVAYITRLCLSLPIFIHDSVIDVESLSSS